MPKVKYLKDLCSGQAGTVCDLQDYEANALIKLGAVELILDHEPVEPVEPVDIGKKGKNLHKKGE